MSYHFISAVYGNAEHSSAVAVTEEVGAVVISSGDTPDDWADLHVSGIEISAFVVIQMVPPTVKRRQLHLALNRMGLRGAVLTWVASADTATQIEFAEASEYRRDHPMWEVGAAALGKTPADIDGLFILAATL